jgi:hypothetical protein
MKQQVIILLAVLTIAIGGCASAFRTDNAIGAAVLGLQGPPEVEESTWYGCAGDGQLLMDGRTGELSCSDGRTPIEVPAPGEWERNTAEALATHANH